MILRIQGKGPLREASHGKRLILVRRSSTSQLIEIPPLRVRQANENQADTLSVSEGQGFHGLEQAAFVLSFYGKHPF